MDKLIKNIRNNHLIAISIGVIYLWFGFLKFFDQLSPAEELATRTMDTLSGSLFSPAFLLACLAIAEVSIGLLLLLNVKRKIVIKAALIHMLFTFTPLFLFAGESFSAAPYGLTLTGQYIMKNLVIIAALITLHRMKEVNPSRA